MWYALIKMSPMFVMDLSLHNKGKGDDGGIIRGINDGYNIPGIVEATVGIEEMDQHSNILN